MKVIYTGFSKCGTKSMAEALRDLGLNVHDFMEHYEVNGKAWMKICSVGGSREDFRVMLDGVDAVTDMPAYHYWEEILDAFPDAKIIHCERESEDAWYKSWYRQLRAPDTFLSKLVGRLSPSWWPFYWFTRTVSSPVLGGPLDDSLFRPTVINELTQRMCYRRHNAYLRQKAPKEKVLYWKLGDGWKPICDHLGLPVPDRPFPHNNKGATLWDDLAKTNKTLQRILVESCIVLLTLTTLSGYGLYRFFAGNGVQRSTELAQSLLDTIRA